MISAASNNVSMEFAGHCLHARKVLKKFLKTEDNAVTGVLTSSGKSLDADIVFMGTGTKPNSMLAAGADTGHILP